MILVIGTQNCSRCGMIKNILTEKGIEYEYKLINEMLTEERDEYMDMAKAKNQMSFPLIIRENKLITLQEVT